MRLVKIGLSRMTGGGIDIHELVQARLYHFKDLIGKRSSDNCIGSSRLA
jgi:hypothetical protein